MMTTAIQTAACTARGGKSEALRREESGAAGAVPTRNELIASACQKLGETARRIEELQARLRSLGLTH